MTTIGRFWARLKNKQTAAASSFDLSQFQNKIYKGNN